MAFDKEGRALCRRSLKIRIVRGVIKRMPGRSVPGRIGEGGGHGKITGVRRKIHRTAKDGHGLRTRIDLNQCRGVGRGTGRTNNVGLMHVDVVEGRIRQFKSFEGFLCRIQTSQEPKAVLCIGTYHVVRRLEPIEPLAEHPLWCAEFGLHGIERGDLLVFQSIQVPPAGLIRHEMQSAVR